MAKKGVLRLVTDAARQPEISRLEAMSRVYESPVRIEGLVNCLLGVLNRDQVRNEDRFHLVGSTNFQGQGLITMTTAVAKVRKSVRTATVTKSGPTVQNVFDVGRGARVTVPSLVKGLAGQIRVGDISPHTKPRVEIKFDPAETSEYGEALFEGPPRSFFGRAATKSDYVVIDIGRAFFLGQRRGKNGFDTVMRISVQWTVRGTGVRLTFEPYSQE